MESETLLLLKRDNDKLLERLVNFTNEIEEIKERLDKLENVPETPPETPETPETPDPEEEIYEWENKWNNPYRKMTKARTPDEYDETTQYRGSGGFCEIVDGIMTLGGRQPRFYVDVHMQNVEVTMEFQRKGNDGKGWSGANVAVRSHIEGHSAMPHLAHTYYFRVKHEGKVDFYRELQHGGGHSKTLAIKKFEWEANKWHKYKFRCFNQSNGTVRLEGFVNDELVLEFEDNNQDMFNARGVVFIRNTEINEALYKNLKIRKLEEDEIPFINVEDEDVEMKIDESSKKKLKFGYYTEWSIYQRKYDVSKIPVDKLDVVCYAFMLANPSKANLKSANLDFPPKPTHWDKEQGVLVPHDEYAYNINMKKFKELKRRNPEKKFLVSLGGWTLSFNLSKILKTRILRNNLVNSIIEFLEENNFDGLDLDWEYPNKVGRSDNSNLDNQYSEKDDNESIIKFFQELREKKPDIMITAAIGCNKKVFEAFKGTENLMDYALLMNYDYSGKTWGDKKPMSDITTDKKYIKLFKEITEFTDDKIIIGVPLYARGWYKDGRNDRLDFGKKYNEDGMISLKDIYESKYKFQVEYDKKDKYCYLENDEWYWSFASLVDKMELGEEYGGVMYWELSDYDI